MGDVASLVDDHDESDYLGLLRQFPEQVREGVKKGRSLDLPASDYDNILVCGMGGSGIVGDLLSQFLFYRSSLPIQTNRFYRVPSWVDRNTLVVVVSYSGNTEETLAACDDALRCDADCLAVTSNGRLSDKVETEGSPKITVPEDLPPRAAAAYLFVPLIFALENVARYEGPDDDVVDRACNHLEDLVSELDPKQESNSAFRTAQQLSDRLPIIYGSEEVTSVLAKRFKNQINENAKQFCAENVIPEMNHNEIMALDHLEHTPDRYGVIFLRDEGEHGRVKKRFQILHDLLDEAVGYRNEIKSRGRSLFARVLTLMLHTDYVSYYLALLNGKDPTSIGYIEDLKQRL